MLEVLVLVDAPTVVVDVLAVLLVLVDVAWPSVGWAEDEVVGSVEGLVAVEPVDGTTDTGTGTGVDGEVRTTR